MPNPVLTKPITLSPQSLLNGQYDAIPGIYICQNTTSAKCHIGLSDDVYRAAQNVFAGNGNRAVYEDFRDGHIFSVTIRPLVSSGLYTLATLAEHYIDRYNANEGSYA